MGRPAKRKADAFEMLRSLRDGPSINIAGMARMSDPQRKVLEAAIKRDVQLWIDTWIIPPCIRLVPELKGQPMCVLNRVKA